MWRFGKREIREVWDQEIQSPLGDIEAAHRIREICRSASVSAEKIAAGGRSEDQPTEIDRYERAAKAAMQIAIKMSDDLLRDSSVRQIVNLCMKANDLRTARVLFRAIQAGSIRDDALNEHPSLGGE
jgi:hypothetical protein